MLVSYVLNLFLTKKKLLSRELQVFNDVDIRMFDNWELKLIK